VGYAHDRGEKNWLLTVYDPGPKCANANRDGD
jgi:hypothetical protein